MPKRKSEVSLRGFETIKSAVHMRQKWCAAVALAGACFLRCLRLRSASALGNF